MQSNQMVFLERAELGGAGGTIRPYVWLRHRYHQAPGPYVNGSRGSKDESRQMFDRTTGAVGCSQGRSAPRIVSWGPAPRRVSPSSFWPPPPSNTSRWGGDAAQDTSRRFWGLQGYAGADAVEPDPREAAVSASSSSPRRLGPGSLPSGVLFLWGPEADTEALAARKTRRLRVLGVY